MNGYLGGAAPGDDGRLEDLHQHGHLARRRRPPGRHGGEGLASHFDAMQAISKIARAEYGLVRRRPARRLDGRAEMFHEFPEHGASEVHLATEFQNMIYEHGAPEGAQATRCTPGCTANAADERKPKDTDEQFLYRSRKKAIGPFKKAAWDLPEAVRAEIGAALRGEVRVPLREAPRSRGRRTPSRRFVKPVELERDARRPARFVRDDEAGD